MKSGPEGPVPVDVERCMKMARDIRDDMIRDPECFRRFWALCSGGEAIESAGDQPSIWQKMGQRIDEAACGMALGALRSSEVIRAMLNGWTPPRPQTETPGTPEQPVEAGAAQVNA